MTGGGSGSGSGSSSGSGDNSAASSSPTNASHRRLPSIKTSLASSTTAAHGDRSSSSRSSAALPTRPQPPPPPPLLLTVRFSTSLPDLLLDIPHPHQTTVAALKHLIRSRLEQPTSQRRLRFIHGGKILPDGAVVGAVLKPLPPPPLPFSNPNNNNNNNNPSSSSSSSTTYYSRDTDHRGASDPKGKGKGVEAPRGHGHPPPPPQRVYVNCSIGDLLTDAELDEERRRAEEPVPEEAVLPSATANTSGSDRTYLPGGGGRSAGAGGNGGGDGTAANPPPPRGFDRLLAAGFTAAEVNQLRLQFRSITEARHTADTMPSPDTLRSMEDAWMDNNNDAGIPSAAAAAAGGAEGSGDGEAALATGDEFGLAGVLDLLLRGMFVGFVWPLGAIGWLVRDEEKIPKRMRVFVYFGFVLSLLIGTIRTIG